MDKEKPFETNGFRTTQQNSSPKHDDGSTISFDVNIPLNSFSQIFSTPTRTENTVKQKLISRLIINGFSEAQANEVIKSCIHFLNEDAGRMSRKGMKSHCRLIEKPYKITWDAPANDYPPFLYNHWFDSMKPTVLKWIDKNKPQAWFREMFVSEKK